MTPDQVWALIALTALFAGWLLSERRNNHALAASKTVNELTVLASNTILEYAERQAQLAANIAAISEGVNQLEASHALKLERLADVVDSLDRNQGAILSGLVNSHIIKYSGATAADLGEMVGEAPITRSAPPLATDRVDRLRVPTVAEDSPLIET